MSEASDMIMSRLNWMTYLKVIYDKMAGHQTDRGVDA
jgi:hypothetical protein